MNNNDPNPYLHVAATDEPESPRDVVDRLTTAECWRLLARGELGRLAVDDADGGPDVFPVNYLVHSGAIYIRSAPGTKLRDITTHPSAAFEIDGESDAFRWSVVVRGVAHRLDTDTEIEESGIGALTSWNPTRKHNFIRIIATTVTGRRFRRRIPDVRAAATERIIHRDAGAPPDEEEKVEGARERRKRPIGIAHFPPSGDDLPPQL